MVTIADDSADGQQVVNLTGSGFQQCRVQIKETLSRPATRSTLASSGSATAPRPSGPSSVGTRIMLQDATRDDPILEMEPSAS